MAIGLDTIEIVMEIEETFGITIPNRDAEKIQTIGDAYRCIIERLEFPEVPGTCLTSHAFYHFRRTLMRKLGAASGRGSASGPNGPTVAHD